MADYAIGLSMHKAHRTIVRAVQLTPPARYFATRGTDGFVTLPTLATGDSYIELQGISQTSFQINDNETEFRLLGDDGWADSVITGARVQASCTTYFMKDAEILAGNTTPTFRGNYEEGFSLIERCRYDKDFEIYVEFLKELGRADGDSGDYIYDFTGFNCVLMNFSEDRNAEGLTEVSFDMMSRGKAVFGRYNAGGSPLSFGGVQSTLLSTAASTGTRRYAVLPADNAEDHALANNITVTYTTDGTTALSQLALAGDGGGFRLEVASSGVAVPATVTLGGAGTNVVTINPDANLSLSTIYRLRVNDGAITQAVDGTGAASASGVKRPLKGFTTTFRTVDV